MSADKWFKTQESKDEQKAFADMKNSVEKAVKGHPLAEKTFKQLKNVYVDTLNNSYYDEVKYGELVVNEIMNEIRWEAIKNQK